MVLSVDDYYRLKKIPKQMLDFDKSHLTLSDLDRFSYDMKFKLWDTYGKQLISEDSAYGWSLLRDGTIYNYAFFKDENDEHFRNTIYQDAISQCISSHDFSFDNPDRYIIFKSSNQSGKSELLVSTAIRLALNSGGENIVIISKSLPQSQFLIARIREMLNNSVFSETWHEDVGETSNTTMLTFKARGGKRTNRIICAPAGEGSLGYPVHRMLLDELDFYDDGKRFFWKVAFARTKKTKGQIICFSNPNPDIGRDSSILWELWTGDLFKRKFHFRFLDAPWNTQIEYDTDKRNVPSHIFCSTHDGEFSDTGGSFFKYREIQDMLQRDWDDVLPVVDCPVYIALDLGKMYDQTIMGIGVTRVKSDDLDSYDDLDILYTEEFPVGTEYDVILDRIRWVRDYYTTNFKGVARIGFDSTGQKTFGDFLAREGIDAFGVDFSSRDSNKTLLYNDLKLMIEKRKLRMVYTRRCEEQFSGMTVKLTPTKQLKVENKSESVHDDYVAMTAIMVHIAVKPSIVPVTLNLSGGLGRLDGQDTADHVPSRQSDIDRYMGKVITDTRKQFSVNNWDV